MTEWLWVGRSAVLAAHDRLLADYGGVEGLRDAGGLDGALGRPVNLALYEKPDVADLAAAYAVGIAKAHAFVDGNKRTAWATARAFLSLNGYTLEFNKAEAVPLMVMVADGQVDQPAVAEWFRSRLRKHRNIR